jgi:hypothetical protein
VLHCLRGRLRNLCAGKDEGSEEGREIVVGGRWDDVWRVVLEAVSVRDKRREEGRTSWVEVGGWVLVFLGLGRVDVVDLKGA